MTRVWYWIIALIRDLLYICKVVHYHLNGSMTFDEPYMENLDGHFMPIILVHGSSGNQSEWADSLDHIKTKFRKHPIYAFSMDLEFDTQSGKQLGGELYNTISLRALSINLDHSIEDYTAILAKHVDYVYNKHNKKVILIGHSMGGLVAAEYERLQPNMVDLVVGICTPFQGARLLSNALIKRFKKLKRHHQMTCGSEFLTRLNASILERNEQYLTIGSTNDLQVHEQDSQLTNVTHKNFSGYGHFSIVNCKAMWYEIGIYFTEGALHNLMNQNYT